MLSSPGGRLESSYDVVVVGSGYGGAIAASRFARAGQSVCVLERGLERHPGDFPETLWRGFRQMQIVTRKRRIGSSTALFDLRLDDEANVLVGCGLGGTSLINGNVALRPEADVLADPRWPTPLRVPGALDPWFDRAEAWLGSNPYPDHAPTLAKLETLGDLADPLGGTLHRAPINVTFAPVDGADPGPNLAGILQPPCNGCGNCIAGCNVGAKNTLAMNYLPDAVRHGAQIFTGRSVHTVLPSSHSDGGWDITFDAVGSGRRRFRRSAALTVRADLVVLAAGTLGSTEILLRSRIAGLAVSDRLGERFTGNGDVLGFGYGADRDINGIGWTRRQIRSSDAKPVGPTITGVVPVVRPGNEPGSGLVVEEGAVPGVLARLMPLTMLLSVIVGSDASVFRRIRMIFSSWRRAARRTFTYLVMSDDAADGRLALEDNHLVVDWPGAVTDRRIADSNALLDRVSDVIGAEYGPQPLWTGVAGMEVVTVHPLGGCVMADDAERGVVDHRGEVFSGVSGTTTHHGLHVLDGSILSRPVDTNPSLTISALTERAVDTIAGERGWTIDRSISAEHRSFADEVAWAGDERTRRSSSPGIRFTERMAGGFGLGVDTPEEGAKEGRRTKSGLSFVLTIEIDDLAELERDPGADQTFSGTVHSPALAPGPLVVENGVFRLFERRKDRAEEWAMVYRMDLHGGDGSAFHLEGRKHIRAGSLLRAWRDTTTLFVTVTELPPEDRGAEGEDGAALSIGTRRVESGMPVIGRGILRISPLDLARQMLTMRTTNLQTGGLRPFIRWRMKRRFLRVFAGRLLPIYDGPIDAVVGTSQPVPTPLLRMLDLPPPTVAWFSPTSGWHDLEGQALEEARQPSVPGAVLSGVGADARLLLTHFPPADSPAPTKRPVMLAAGFSMRANSLALPTGGPTLAETLAEAGFDVWLFDYRSSIALPSSHHDHTLDDIAQVDWPEGIDEVRRRTGADSVHVIGHCVGSVSILMAILAGADGVRSAVCSQFALHPRTSWLNRIKNAARIVDLVDAVGIEGLAPTDGRSLRSRITSRAVKLLPIPRGESCQQPVCRWLNGVFGLTHTHDQLDADTHDAFSHAFGNGDVTTLQHLGRITRAKRAVDADGNDVYLPHVDRLGLPLLFIQGSKNYIFKPKGTEATLSWLRANHANSDELHHLLTLDGYAHLDGMVGRNVHRDVYPHILEHLERHA